MAGYLKRIKRNGVEENRRIHLLRKLYVDLAIAQESNKRGITTDYEFEQEFNNIISKHPEAAAIVMSRIKH